MAKITNDKYYTPNELSKQLIDLSFKTIGFENITEIIEPSAGSGSFSNQINNCIAYDIEPENKNIIKTDFLKTNLEYKKGRLIIGNPPFGSKNILAKQFYKYSCKISDYVAFILPISQLNQNYELFDFDLIKSNDLGYINYSDRKLHCCFNIYKRPINGQLNKKNLIYTNLQDIKWNIVATGKGRNDKIPTDYDITICAWGAIGKFCKENEYNTQIYIKILNNELKEPVINFLKNYDYNLFKNIATPKLQLWKLYDILKKEFPELK